MSLLALDLGTRTGWAWKLAGKTECGTFATMTAAEVKAMNKADTDRDFDPRFCRLWEFLSVQFHASHAAGDGLTDIFFEDVEFLSYQKQAQIWGGFRAIVMAFAGGCYPKIRTRGVAVGTLKKFATGHGGATKEMMERALKRLNLHEVWMDDNCVDAYHLLRFASAEMNNKS